MDKEMAKPDLGVIMSVYKEEETWLCEAIDSILNQTYKNFRFYILLDDPENDLLRQVLLRYQEADSRMVLLENPKNMGLVASLNRLIALVEEPFIARMDADDVAAETRLEKERKFLLEKQLDFVMTGADFLDEKGTRSAGPQLPTLGPAHLAACCRYGNVSIHSSWFLKKNVYEELDGYRDCRYCEDFDFILRALQAGKKIGRLGEKLQRYRIRTTGISARYAMEQDEKVAYLHRIYRQGEAVCKVDPAWLNQEFGSFSEEDCARYRADRASIDRLARALCSQRYKEVVSVFLKNFFTRKYFRTLFRRLFFNRIRLGGIYRMADKTPF